MVDTSLTLLLVSMTGCLYPTVVYPLLVIGLSRCAGRSWSAGRWQGKAALIITVHNESRRIREKLTNTLEVMPGGVDWQIIVADDGSTDDTPALVQEFAERGVRCLILPRRGKEYAQIDAIRSTEAEILIFSDASTTLFPESLREIVAPFVDPSVGAVGGVDRISSGGGEGLFLEYEMTLRRAESLCGGLVGMSGCFFAARRCVALQLQPDVPSDMGAALICANQRLRAVSQEAARCTYAPTATSQQMFRRWRRTALRGMRCLLAYRPLRGQATVTAKWQIISHKWMRFTVPFFALLGLVAVALAVAQGAQWAVAGLCLAALGLISGARSLQGRRKTGGPLQFIGFLFVTNLAVAAAWLHLITGQKQVHWSPTAR